MKASVWCPTCKVFVDADPTIPGNYCAECLEPLLEPGKRTLTEQDRQDIEALIVKHKPEPGCVTPILVLLIFIILVLKRC